MMHSFLGKMYIKFSRTMIKEYEINFPSEWIWLFLFLNQWLHLLFSLVLLLKNVVSKPVVQVFE